MGAWDWKKARRIGVTTVGMLEEKPRVPKEWTRVDRAREESKNPRTRMKDTGGGKNRACAKEPNVR